VAFPTAGYLLYGSVDFFLGTTMGLVAVVGVVVGARIAHAAPAAMLRAWSRRPSCAWGS
jgi:uncharacterized membrane protein YfcA